MKNLYFIYLIFAILFNSCQTVPQKKFGGLALYTVRNEMQKQPKETLKKVSEIGYAYVEDAGYSNGKFYDLSPEEYKLTLKNFDLIPLSTHQGGMNFENANKIISDVKKVGFQFVVIPFPPMGIFDESNKISIENKAEKLANFLNEIGKKCDSAGLKLLYHNHDFEFKKHENGFVVFDYLIENTNPKFVNFELDLYWTTKAGANPIDYFYKAPDRFKMWHVKDMDKNGHFAPVGKGEIDFEEILLFKKLSGMEFYFVEQDETYDLLPLEAIKISHKELRKLGFQ